MDRNDANQGNEDNSEAVAHVNQAQENRDALAEQNRRTEATAGDSANHPIRQTNTGSEDTSRAAANSSNAHENRDALAEQNRRTNETT